MLRIVRCKKCGELFKTTSSRKSYCHKPIKVECKVCGKLFDSECTEGAPYTCSHSCASKAVALKTKKCSICGDEFIPNSSRQKYCNKPIKKICSICGEEFEAYCNAYVIDRCICNSPECLHAYQHQRSVEAWQGSTRICEWCGAEFHPVNNTQKYCDAQHYQTCKICGKQFPIVIKNTADIPITCSELCMRKWIYRDGNPFSKPEVRAKMRQTCLTKYGVEHPMRNPEVALKCKTTYQKRTGFASPMANPAIRSKAGQTIYRNGSQFERRIIELLSQYNIEINQHHIITNGELSHEFDLYLPKYNILIDCDGIYWHSYLSDPDGGRVDDSYDEVRVSLIPEDYIFFVIVEGNEESTIKAIVNTIKQIDADAFDYVSDLFNWCRSIEFPEPSYTLERMIADYKSLCNYSSETYNPRARLGASAINQYHKSIYDANVGNYPSPREAWNDDNLLKKVILNRLIYKNDVDPYKVMKGFNISKICPRVSIFNPVLAKYLTLKYLSSFEEVFDPFSGFSGRLLGVTAANKQYIGQDLNTKVVEESNQLIADLGIICTNIKNVDILEDSGKYECLLTCPPYGTKEHYASETVYNSCDEWIDEILKRYDCNRYVFVVDNSEKFKGNIVETLKSSSHLSDVFEYVVVIDKQ